MLEVSGRRTMFFRPNKRDGQVSVLGPDLNVDELADKGRKIVVEKKIIAPGCLPKVRGLITKAGWRNGESGLDWADRILFAGEMEGIFMEEE